MYISSDSDYCNMVMCRFLTLQVLLKATHQLLFILMVSSLELAPQNLLLRFGM